MQLLEWRYCPRRSIPTCFSHVSAKSHWGRSPWQEMLLASRADMTDQAGAPMAWRTVRHHLEELLDLDRTQRAEYFDRELGAESALRRELEELLAAEAEAGDLLEVPFAEVSSGLLAEIGGESPGSDRVGSQAGPWTLLSLLGEGGMGRVYLASRKGEGYEQRVALKILRIGQDSVEAHARFRRERAVLARLSHPAIAAFVDGGWTEDGRPYVAMEYVEGRAVDIHCDENRLGIDERLELFCAICEAVDFAHRRLIVHRDLKPSNVFITNEGQVKLLDFGIAKVLEPGLSEEVTVFGAPLTPGYSSPEQRSGLVITTATDVYSLGVLLWEILLGTRPSGAVSPGEETKSRASRRLGAGLAADRFAQVLAQRRTTELVVRRRLTGDLDAILLQALAEHPEERYHGPAELAEDIHRFLAGVPVKARQNTLIERLGKLARRNRLATVVSGVALVSIVAGGASSAFLAHRATEQRDLARLEARRAEDTMQLLRGILATSVEDRSAGATLTVRELLDQAEARLAQEDGSSPETRLRVLAILTDLYNSLALYPEAVRVAERGVEAGLIELEPSNIELARARDRLGLSLVMAGEPARAVPHLEMALASIESAYGETDPEVLEVLRHLSWAAGVRPLVETHALRQTIRDRERRRAAGGDTPGLAQALNDHARTLHFLGRGDEAIRQLDEALAMRRRLGMPSSQLIVALDNRSMAEAGLGQGPKAEESAREALRLALDAPGATGLSPAMPWTRLAQALLVQQRFPEALEAASEAVSLRRSYFPDGHESLAAPLLAQGEAQCQLGLFEEAERDLREAISTLGRSFSPDGWRVAEGKTALGLCLLEQGREVEALDLIRSARIRIVAFLGEETPIGRTGGIVLDERGP